VTSTRLRFLSFFSRVFVKRWLSGMKDVQDLRLTFKKQAARTHISPPYSDYRTGRIGRKGRKSKVKWVSCGKVRNDDLLFYIHGGGYILGSPNTHKHMIAHLCRSLGTEAVLPFYRLAPEHPFPAGFNDVVAGYHAVVVSGRDPGRIIFGGDSAGGGLMFALLAYLAKNSLPMPLCCFAMSPSVDFTDGSRSREENANKDAVLVANRFGELRDMYLGAHDPKDPVASPLFAELPNCPPVLMHVGDDEILLDDTLSMQNHLEAQGVDVLVRNWPTGFHVWHMMLGFVPEAREALDDIARFVAKHQKAAPTSR